VKVAAIARQEAQLEDGLQAARQRSAQQATGEFYQASNVSPSKPSLGVTADARPEAIVGARANSHVAGHAVGPVNSFADALAQHPTAALAGAQLVIASQSTSSVRRSAENIFARRNRQLRWDGRGAEGPGERGWLARSGSRSGSITGRAGRSLEARAAYLTQIARQRPRPGPRYFGVTTLSDTGGTQWRLIFKRRCPSILESSREYDDDLVWLCRKWAERN